MSDFVKRTGDYIRVHNLISGGDKILTAFSGGPDSMALLTVLQSLKKKMRFELSAAYVNHCIRPRAAVKENSFCAEICRNFGITFHQIEVDVPALAEKNHLSMEEAARIYRLEELKKIASEQGYDKIALGHQRDDQIETILFRLFRGTGPGGLTGIKPRSGILIRPLLDFHRDEIVEFLAGRKLEYMIDRTNLESDYSRNFIRNRIIPVIREHFGDKYREAILNFARITAEENRFLHDAAEKELKRVASVSRGGKFIVDLTRFLGYALWLKRRIIKLLLEKIGGRPGIGTFGEVERVLDVSSGKLKKVDLAGNIHVVAHTGRLLVYRKKVFIKKRELPYEGSLEMEEIDSRMTVRRISRSGAILGIQKKGLRVNVDAGKIAPPMFVRGIRSGDRFHPLGLSGTKKIGDYLTDRKVPPDLRDEIPLVYDINGVVWLVGLEISDRVRIEKNTRKVLQIELVEKGRTRRKGV
jgi:tRNA(Ile)-lysidine synthase